MWRDVKIGDGDHQCSAWIIYTVPGGSSISHNQVSYWISGCVLGIGVTIMKNTPEGAELTQLLKAPDPQEIEDWLSGLVFRHCDPKVLVKRLEISLNEAFKAGRAAKTAEIRACLGV